ncbi:hypothetical protein [uncultured Sunxiuqinia sp.]|uniref:hypothetical protein n=1 Tax=uncultured Sunxiuqinia sp. TaxID=1573825 RepID=UPI002637C54E|nr:hypothetical protein [uncultured Sunxiuqinia sp.]
MKLLLFFLLLYSVQFSSANVYYVSPGGSDNNPGTLHAPFKTINKATYYLQPGDTCIIRGGTYRETVKVNRGGTRQQPIVFKAYPGEIPILSGTERVTGKWEHYKGKIYRIKLETTHEILQVFLNDSLMTWARWPNASFNQRWSNKKWRTTHHESTLGMLKDSALSEMNIDWTDAVVTLNTGPNWNKWTAIVENHEKGADHFYYSKALQWKQFVNPSQAGNGSYYLSGKLEALDAPEEWFYDSIDEYLYLFTPKGDHPGKDDVEYKQRNYGFLVEKSDYLKIEGIHFFACTFNFRECNNCTVNGCHLRFLNAARTLNELNIPSGPTICTQMIGHHNTVCNSSLAYSPTFGLRMLGSYNVVENNLIYDVNWVGALVYANVWMGSLEDNYSWEGGLKYEGMLNETVSQATSKELKEVKWGGSTGNIVAAHDPDKAKPAGNCAVRYNTLFGSGNIVLGFFEQPNYDISYNRVYDGGHFVHDVSMIYTTLPQIRGSAIHHNWVSTMYKLCIRADDQSRGVCIHHNVMWGSSKGSLVVKGEDNNVYHNTTLKPKSPSNWGLNVQVWPEPDKPHYRKLWPLLDEQNKHTPVWNNLTHKITDHHIGRLYPADDPRLSNNLVIANPDSLLVNSTGMEFRPCEGSPLVDAARRIEGINDNYIGKAPDIGAYELGGEYWIPGYRNFICKYDSAENNKSGLQTLLVTLAMPPLHPINVIAKSNHKNVSITKGEKLLFTPENWMVPQAVEYSTPQKIEINYAVQLNFEK